MIKEVVSSLMESLGLPYMYWEFEDTGDGIPGCYFVGERLPDRIGDESPGEGGTFVVSGWSSVGLDPLDEAEAAIREALSAPGGDLRRSGDGWACAVWYMQAQDVPSDVEGRRRVEFTLGYEEWS